jgi:hypothetical protein
LLSHLQNAGQNHEIKTADSCFGNVAQLKYLGMRGTNQNLIQEEIKRRLNSGSAKNINIRMCCGHERVWHLCTKLV